MTSSSTHFNNLFDYVLLDYFCSSLWYCDLNFLTVDFVEHYYCINMFFCLSGEIILTKNFEKHISLKMFLGKIVILKNVLFVHAAVGA